MTYLLVLTFSLLLLFINCEIMPRNTIKNMNMTFNLVNPSGLWLAKFMPFRNASQPQSTSNNSTPPSYAAFIASPNATDILLTFDLKDFINGTNSTSRSNVDVGNRLDTDPSHSFTSNPQVSSNSAQKSHSNPYEYLAKHMDYSTQVVSPPSYSNFPATNQNFLSATQQTTCNCVQPFRIFSNRPISIQQDPIHPNRNRIMFNCLMKSCPTNGPQNPMVVKHQINPYFAPNPPMLSSAPFGSSYGQNLAIRDQSSQIPGFLPNSTLNAQLQNPMVPRSAYDVNIRYPMEMKPNGDRVYRIHDEPLVHNVPVKNEDRSLEILREALKNESLQRKVKEIDGARDHEISLNSPNMSKPLHISGNSTLNETAQAMNVLMEKLFPQLKSFNASESFLKLFYGMMDEAKNRTDSSNHKINVI